MTEPLVARFYLYPDLRRRVDAGRRGFLTSLAEVLRAHGWEVILCDDTPEELLAAKDRPGYSLVRMTQPPNARGLTFRRTYFAPFWHIERQAERWSWPVAQAVFDPATVNPAKAQRFFGNLRHKHLGEAPETRRDGFVLVPLQGRLLEQRSFQSCSPIEMMEALLEHDPERRIVACLHPKERYSVAEIDALEKLERNHRFTLTEHATERLLPLCDYVATMNSSVAFKGYLLEKPAVLFAGIDFHHIAANVSTLGQRVAIEQAPELKPDFAAYLWWFLRDHAIDDSRPDAPTRIKQALHAGGWPL
jgi:hypothetical protein